MTGATGRALLTVVLLGVAAAALGARAGAGAAGPLVLGPWTQERAPAGASRLEPLPRAASPPVEVEIPAIGVRASIVPVGLRPDGSAEVPAPADAGWWRLGAAPGQPGSAVLLGHRDTTSAAAVFARLPELAPGHLIGVRRADGLVAVFVVRALTRHDKEALPLAIWRPSGSRPLLRLVTCGGDFDRSRGSYRQNVVVHAEALGAWRPDQPGQALPVSAVTPR